MIKIRELGAEGLYAPKYHSELQLPIENAWCDAKRTFRNEQDFILSVSQTFLHAAAFGTLWNYVSILLASSLRNSVSKKGDY